MRQEKWLEFVQERLEKDDRPTDYPFDAKLPILYTNECSEMLYDARRSDYNFFGLRSGLWATQIYLS
jgi:hypothetical protein